MAKNNYIQFYTAGSAAQKVELVDEREWAPLPEYQLRRRKTIHIDPVAIIGILVAVFLMGTMLLGVNQLVGARQEAMQMEEYVAQLQTENHELSQKYADGYDLGVVEMTALNMGMVPKDQAPQISIQVQMPEVDTAQNSTLWEQFTTFLTGLFA